VHTDAERVLRTVRVVDRRDECSRGAGSVLELGQARRDGRRTRAQERLLRDVERRALERCLERAGHGREDDVPEEETEEHADRGALGVHASGG
jgi:chromosome condensin MukBEF MukE localization factor